MNEPGSGNKPQSGKTFFLSEILRKPVIVNGKKIGKLTDIIILENLIVESGKIPEVTHLYVTRPFGYPSLLIPWEKVQSLTPDGAVAQLENVELYVGEPSEGAVLLRDHILDKKVLDTEGREVEVVYDVKLLLRNNKLYVTDVDLSRYGLLRRIGLKGLADFIYRLADKIKDQTISWSYIQPLPTEISSFKGNVKLRILKEKLSEIPPVDLADILEKLDSEQRTAIFEKLDTEHASDTLEEIDPNVQRDLVSSLKKEKVAQLIEEMTPAQAADLLSALPVDQADDLLDLLQTEKAKKVRSILEQQEQKILNFATHNFLKFKPDRTVSQTLRVYRRNAKGKDVIMYLYIVDDNNKLLGVIDLKEVLQAPEETPLKDVMVSNVVTLKPESTLKEASEMFARYGFRAIPITDENDKLLGLIPYRDIMNLKHRFLE